MIHSIFFARDVHRAAYKAYAASAAYTQRSNKRSNRGRSAGLTAGCDVSAGAGSVPVKVSRSCPQRLPACDEPVGQGNQPQQERNNHV